MKRGGRRDGNHQDIVRTFRALGWYVHDTADLGAGFPDLVIARAGCVRLVEIKDGRLEPARQQLTTDEATVHRDFAVAGVQVDIVRSVDDAAQLDVRVYAPARLRRRLAVLRIGR